MFDCIYILFKYLQVAGTDEYMEDSFEMFKTQCSNEIRTNNSLWSQTDENGTVIAKLITENYCQYECKYNGIKLGDCVEGKTSIDHFTLKNVRENRRGNQEWTIQRHWQHWVHKT